MEKVRQARGMGEHTWASLGPDVGWKERGPQGNRGVCVCVCVQAGGRNSFPSRGDPGSGLP